MENKKLEKGYFINFAFALLIMMATVFFISNNQKEFLVEIYVEKNKFFSFCIFQKIIFPFAIFLKFIKSLQKEALHFCY